MASPYPAARTPVHWWDSVLHERASGVAIRWKDGLVGGTTDDGKWAITSPNASYVPRPMMGTIRIAICGDGHYGAADPIHWPQIFSHDTRFIWLAALHQQPSKPADPLALVRKVFSLVDFAPLPGVGGDLGIAKETCMQRITPCVEQTLELAQAVQTCNGVNRELQWLVSSLEEAFDRLDIPASYCDIARQYACVQRFLLYTAAWLDWHVGVLRTYTVDDYIQPNFSEFMGCITTSPVLVERLFKLKVPVWYLRAAQEFTGQEVVERQLLLTEPKKIMSFVDEGVQAFNESQLLGRVSITMLAGDHHIDWINREVTRYLDKESRPVPANNPPAWAYGLAAGPSEASTSGAIRSAPVAPKERYEPYPASKPVKQVPAKSQREKFKDPSHACLPPPITGWQEALAEVDMSRPAPTHEATWKFWLPEARLVVTPATQDRQRRYIRNWLRLRETWLYLIRPIISNNEEVEPLRASQWRAYLNSSEMSQDQMGVQTDKTKKGKKRAENIREVSDIFSDIFKRNIMDCPIPSMWFGRDIAHMDDAQWTRLAQEVAWELCHISFRLELLELDRYLVPSSANDDPMTQSEHRKLLTSVFPPGQKMVLKSWPTVSDGLAARKNKDRAPYLEALRTVLCRWPAVPSEIKESTPFTAMPSGVMFKQREKALARFYCQTFFEVAGRAPSLPRRLPGENAP